MLFAIFSYDSAFLRHLSRSSAILTFKKRKSFSDLYPKSIFSFLQIFFFHNRCFGTHIRSLNQLSQHRKLFQINPSGKCNMRQLIKFTVLRTDRFI